MNPHFLSALGLLFLPKCLPHTACVDARDLNGHIGDFIHYNTESQKVMGQRSAEEYLKLSSSDESVATEWIPDLTVPEVTEGAPAPGKRVRQVNVSYHGTEVHHLLYLPTDWQAGKRYPVIVEYAGNKWPKGPGTVEASNLGYGISGGEGFIWVCMPYVSKDHQRNEVRWWGDEQATVDYCIQTVERVCREYGGDHDAVVIAGFSRGAIACNYIGLYNDEIASLWRAFIPHDHYDGERNWGKAYEGSDRASALVRLERLKGRPQYISSMPNMAVRVEKYFDEIKPEGDFTFGTLHGFGHTDSWVLYDVPERKKLREWLAGVLWGNDE